MATYTYSGSFPVSPTAGETLLMNGVTYTYNANTLWEVTSALSDAPSNNFVATTAPTATDDSGSGYTVGSVWVDVTNDKSYTCVDATATSAVWSSGGQGKVLQVVQDVKTDTFSTAVGASSNTAITGLSATITPSATSSKVLVNVYIGSVAIAGAGNAAFFLKRGSTAISIGDAASTRARASMLYGDSSSTWGSVSMSLQFLDSPSTTSATTYSVNVGGNGSATVYINYVDRDADGVNEDARSASAITLMEIGV